MPVYGKNTGRDVTDDQLIRLRELEDEVRRIRSSPKRSSIDRGDTAAVAAPFEGQIMVQYDTNALMIYKNGAWGDFGGGAGIDFNKYNSKDASGNEASFLKTFTAGSLGDYPEGGGFVEIKNEFDNSGEYSDKGGIFLTEVGDGSVEIDVDGGPGGFKILQDSDRGTFINDNSNTGFYVLVTDADGSTTGPDGTTVGANGLLLECYSGLSCQNNSDLGMLFDSNGRDEDDVAIRFALPGSTEGGSMYLFVIDALPNFDPHVQGALWDNSGVVARSHG